MIVYDNDSRFQLIPVHLLASFVYPELQSDITKERWTAVKQEDTFQHTFNIMYIYIPVYQ